MAEELKACQKCGAGLGEHESVCPACGTEWISGTLDDQPTRLPGESLIEGEFLGGMTPESLDPEAQHRVLDDVETRLPGEGVAMSGSGNAGDTASRQARYKIIEKIGEGGMGVVYKAEDTKLGRVVAIKRLLPKAEAQQKGLDRFMREANVVAKLNHINIVGIYDIERDNNGPFIVMEYVEGRSLEEIIESDGKIDEAKPSC